MQVLRTYQRINPLLLYGEVDDIVKRYGGTVDKEKSFKELPPGGVGLKGSIVANFPVEVIEPRPIFGSRKKIVQKEAFNARILATTEEEIKLMIYIDEESIPLNKAKAIEADLDFFIASYEKKT